MTSNDMIRLKHADNIFAHFDLDGCVA